VQPSGVPTALPSVGATGQPSSQPTSVPSVQPSQLPRAAPTSKPSLQPSAQPSALPTTQPSAYPTQTETGEWATVVGSMTTTLTSLFYPTGNVWSCGSGKSLSVTECVLVDSLTGAVTTKYAFEWKSVVSIFTTAPSQTILISGHGWVGSTMTSEVATCSIDQGQLQCTVTSYFDAKFLSAAYVAYPNRIAYIGWYNTHASASIFDVKSSSLSNYLYTARNMKALALSHMRCPPAFVGCFVAGTTIRATASPVKFIIAGMLRTNGGMLNAMALMPEGGDILNSADLVNAMALEVIGPDSFIAGGLQLSDRPRSEAYLLRANALYSTIIYCVRYSSFSGRRALSSVSPTMSSVVRGMVLVDGATLFMIIDRTANNVTAVTVLKTNAVNGEIIKQVHLTAPNATSFKCTDIVVSTVSLHIVCSTYNHATSPQSLLLAVDQDLSFAVLPSSFLRTEEAVFQVESVPFQRTVLSVTQTSTSLATSTYASSTANRNPTRRPSTAPPYVPSSQPSSEPSTQPSSRPTAEPTVSAHPTSQPSSARPTNTRKPTVEQTVSPTKKPSAAPTASPSQEPTAVPTLQPSTPPSAASSVVPTLKPSALPTGVPKQKPSVRPSKAPSDKPAVGTDMPSSQPTTPSGDGGNNPLPGSFVEACVGIGLGVLAIGYGLYQYYQYRREEKAKDGRRKEWRIRQNALAEAAAVATAKYIQYHEDQKAAFKLQQQQEREEKLAEKRAKEGKKASRAAKNGRGAYVTGPVFVDVCSPSPLPALMQSAGSSSEYTISNLHSSDRGSTRSDATHYTTERAQEAMEEGCIGQYNSESRDFTERIVFLNDEPPFLMDTSVVENEYEEDESTYSMPSDESDDDGGAGDAPSALLEIQFHRLETDAGVAVQDDSSPLNAIDEREGSECSEDSRDDAVQAQSHAQVQPAPVRRRGGPRVRRVALPPMYDPTTGRRVDTSTVRKSGAQKRGAKKAETKQLSRVAIGV